MKTKLKKFINFILPAFILPCLVGFIAGSITFFYRWLAEELGSIALTINGFVLTHLWLIPIILLAFVGIAIVQSIVIKYAPVAKGGGIPTSEGIIRGSIYFNPFITMILTVILSFVSFIIGIPLGSEGPSVSIGTSIGALFTKNNGKKESCYKRYLMTAGASASFGVATGSPISGIIFALEEIHRKFSPLIVIVSFSSVVCGSLIARLLSGLTNIDYHFFNFGTLNTLEYSRYWILIPLGIIIGLIAMGFNKLIKLSQHIQDKSLAKVPTWVKLLISFSVTFLIGLLIPEFLNGGHRLVLKMMGDELTLLLLVILLALKIVLVAWISQSGVTGGMFIPILTIGALIGAIIAKLFKLDDVAPLIITISMAAFMASCIGCPLSAIVFSFETLAANETTILAYAITILIAFVTTRVFNTTHIYDVVLERKLHNDYSHKKFKVIEVTIKVCEDSFAVRKQVRDLLLSANLLILSIKRENKDYGKMDNFGDKYIHASDLITFRCQSYNTGITRLELESFFGYQENYEYQVIQE